jgi:hypothetical protein
VVRRSKEKPSLAGDETLTQSDYIAGLEAGWAPMALTLASADQESDLIPVAVLPRGRFRLRWLSWA